VVVLWDVASGKEAAALKDGEVAALAFSPDGKLLASGSHGSVALWDVAARKRLSPDGGHTGHITTLAFRPDGKQLLTAGEDGSIRYWEPSSGREVEKWQSGSCLHSLVFSADGRTLGLSSGYGVRLSRQDAKTLFFGSKPGGSTGFSDPWLGAAYQDHSFQAVAFAPDNQTFALGGCESNRDGRRGPGRIFLCAAGSGKELKRLEPEDGEVCKLAFSPDGTLLASLGGRCGVKLWQTASGKEIRQLGEDLRVMDVLFSPDGATVAMVGGNEIRFVKTADGRDRWPPWRLTAHQGTVAFSPDGRMLAFAHNKTAYLFEVATGKERRRFDGHREPITRLAFSPCGRFLATASEDTTALLWQVTAPLTEKPVRLRPEQLNKLWSDLASPDARAAYQAIGELAAAAEQAVPFFKERLRPVPPADRYAGLIADLESDRFAVRQRATQELERAGDAAEPAVHDALRRNPSLETRTRLERLLEKLDGWSAERQQTLRAIEVLENIGTGEARLVLDQVTSGPAEARRTQQAKAARDRMAKRSSNP
jgi:WD40 repeat protein